MPDVPLPTSSPPAPAPGGPAGPRAGSRAGPTAADGPPDTFHRLDLNAPYPYSTDEYAKRFVWQLVQATFYRWSPRRAYAWRRFLLRSFGATIGPHVRFRTGARVFHPWLLEVGDWSSVADDVDIYNLGPVSIGRHTSISQGTYVCAGTHDYAQPDLPLVRPPIRIGSGVWIAAQAFIGPGVTIGDNSVVGARAVVVKNIPAGVVAAGNPARVIKPRPMSAAGADSSPPTNADGRSS